MRRLRRDWQKEAECRGGETNVYFTSSATDITEVRTTCGGCQVRYECLAHALDFPERDGFWGGMTEGERRALHKRQPKIKDWHGVLEVVLQRYGRLPINDTRNVVESMAVRVVYAAESLSPEENSPR